MMMMAQRRIGIDPGIRRCGWGVIEQEGNSLRWIADGTITPQPDRADGQRLAEIYDGLVQVISHYQPHEAAVEAVFVARNPSSALKLGMARGAALLACAAGGLAVAEIAARRAKQNITGSGRADKAQMQAMVSRLLLVTPSSADAADALAIAIASLNEQTPALAGGTGVSGGVRRRGNSKDAIPGGASGAASSGLEDAIARALVRDAAAIGGSGRS